MTVRLCFIGAFLVASLIFLGSEASARTYKVLMVETMPVKVILDHEKFFLEGLLELGYQEGESVSIDLIKADGERQKAVRLLREYLTQNTPDIVVTFATLASQAAADVLKGTSIPIVFCVVSNPVGAGLVEAVGKPSGTNITGLIFSLLRKTKVDLAQELLKQPFQDRPVRLGVVHSTYPAQVSTLDNMRKMVADDPGIDFVSYSLQYRAMPAGLGDMLRDAERGIAELSSKVDFWWILPGPLGESKEFSQLLLSSSVPVGLCHTKDCTKNGGIFYITPNTRNSGRQVADIVDSILKGKDVGTIPVVPPDSFDFGLNLTTAVKHGIIPSSETLDLAGENVWR